MTRVRILRHETKESSQRTTTQLNAAERTGGTASKSSRAEGEGPWGRWPHHDGMMRVAAPLRFATPVATMSQSEGVAG